MNVFFSSFYLFARNEVILFACNIVSQFSPPETPPNKTQLYNISVPFNLVLYTKHCQYLYRKDQGLPWFPVSEIKDFVKDLEKGTIRKNTRSRASVCFPRRGGKLTSPYSIFGIKVPPKRLN